MGRTLSGAMGDSLSFVVSRFSGLVTVSFLPFVVLAGCMAAYCLQIEARIEAVETADMEELAQSSAGDMLFSIAFMLLFMWLAAKVHRLYLADEAPSLIGSGGTMKAAFFMCVYYVGVLFVTYIPMMVAALILGFGLFYVSEAATIVAIFVALAAALWVLLRLMVGLVPIALGEWPGFFSGWSLTKGRQMPLLLGIVGLSLILLSVVLAVFAVAFGIGYVFFDALVASIGITGLAVIGSVVYSALSIVLNWPMIVYFAEVYVRLSGRERPLPIS